MTSLVRVTSSAANGLPCAPWVSVWSGDGSPMCERRISSDGLSVCALAAFERGFEPVEVVGHLAEVDDVPAVRPEPRRGVVVGRHARRSVDRDQVVVEDADQLAEPEVAGERGRLVADALHQATVTGDHERVVVLRLGAEPGAQVPLGDRHADGVGESLTERSRRDLDAGGVAGLGVAGCGRLPLAEVPQIVEFEAVAGQEQQRVLQDRRVAVGEDEPVTVGPGGIGRVVLHDPAVEHVAERGERHRGALVAAVGGERAVHRHPPDERDGELVLFCGQRHAGESTRGSIRTNDVQWGLTPVVTSGGREKGERHDVPRTVVDAAVGEHLAVVGELELAANQPVGELARLDRERADVASDLFAVVVEAAPEHHLEHAGPLLGVRAEDQPDQMRRDRDRRRLRVPPSRTSRR